MEQRARELTPQEVAAGIRGINDKDLTATQIQALVRTMDDSKVKWASIKANKPEYEAKLKQENENLYFNYPTLFQMHAEDRLDATFFSMLSLKRKIEAGELTPEAASAQVGQMLFQRFVPRPDTPVPPPQLKYEDFYKRM